MFEIINNTDKEIDYIKEIDKYIKYIIKKMELKKCIFNVIFITDEEIHKLNKEYRKVDRKTDVITFALEDVMDVNYSKFRLLGDVYISLDTAYEQAKMYNHSDKREICFLITHGILHLLGFDHMEEDDEKEMFDLQKELLDNYGIKR